MHEWLVRKNLSFYNSRIKSDEKFVLLKFAYNSLDLQIKNHNFTLYVLQVLLLCTCILKQIQTTTAYSLNNGVADVSLSRRTNKANEL